jgi:hypothetical protein
LKRIPKFMRSLQIGFRFARFFESLPEKAVTHGSAVRNEIVSGLDMSGHCHRLHSGKRGFL